MNKLIALIDRSNLLKFDLEYHLLRASMVVIFAWFGYDKWFDVEIRDLLPLINNGPLISWMIPLLGVSGTSVLLGVSEWTFGSLLFAGYWNKTLGVLGALGATSAFIGTLTILPFAPDAWHAEAGGFPAMTIVSGFLLKDFVLLSVSLYLLKQDLSRLIAARRRVVQG